MSVMGSVIPFAVLITIALIKFSVYEIPSRVVVFTSSSLFFCCVIQFFVVFKFC